jgi:predicted DCC family thiol-disulfide oxidoreductase YuxK
MVSCRASSDGQFCSTTATDECRFAARAVACLDRRERLALLPLDDPVAPALVSPLLPKERYASWHLVWPDGRVSSQGAASINLLAGLGWPRLASTASWLERPLDALYKLVADHRDRIGPLVPDGSAPRRFP